MIEIFVFIYSEAHNFLSFVELKLQDVDDVG